MGENSGGPRCLKYGVTTNHVLGLEVFYPTARCCNLGGAAHDPPGYDLRALLIGSEGTLAVVTEVTVRIMPKPEKVMTQLVVYNDVDGRGPIGGRHHRRRDSPGDPRNDGCPDHPGGRGQHRLRLSPGRRGGPDHRGGRARRRSGKTGRAHPHDLHWTTIAGRSATPASAEERSRLWEGRRGAFGAVARLAPNYLVNDCTVPRTLLPEALAQVAAIVTNATASSTATSFTPATATCTR